MQLVALIVQQMEEIYVIHAITVIINKEIYVDNVRIVLVVSIEKIAVEHQVVHVKDVRDVLQGNAELIVEENIQVHVLKMYVNVLEMV